MWKASGTSSLRSLSKKCWATCAGRILSSRHSLCSRCSFMSSTSFFAWRPQRKSSRAVASSYQWRIGRGKWWILAYWIHIRVIIVCLIAIKAGSVFNRIHLSAVEEDSHHKHQHKNNTDSIPAQVMRPDNNRGDHILFSTPLHKNTGTWPEWNLYL